MISNETFGIIGIGRLGQALATALTAAGLHVELLYDSDEDKARPLVEELDGPGLAGSGQAVVDTCDTVFLTVPDHAIEATCRELKWRRENLAIHCSGSMPIRTLQCAIEAGARTGGFHPLSSFAGRSYGATRFMGAAVAIEGDEQTAAFLTKVAHALGCQPFTISGDERTLYHAAAVIAGNFCTTLLHMSSRLVRDLEHGPPDKLLAMTHLMSAALENAREIGVATGLSGPVARCDVDVLKKHIDVLSQRDEEYAEIYRLLTHQTIHMALEGGLVEDEQAQAMILALKGDA